MTRRRHRFLRAVPAILALGWMGTAEAANAFTPAQCQEELEICIDSRQTCENDLWLMGRAVGDCNTEAGVVQADLAGCETSLGQAEGDLAICTAEPRGLQRRGVPGLRTDHGLPRG